MKKKQITALLMSIKPEYAELILSGKKHFELRRKRVGASPGELVVIYASGPVMSVVGYFTAGMTHWGTPGSIWGLRNALALGVTKEEFFEYYKGAEDAWALGCLDPVRVEPIPLKTLRNRFPGFTPPQSWMYWRSPFSELIRPPLIDPSKRTK